MNLEFKKFTRYTQNLGYLGDITLIVLISILIPYEINIYARIIIFIALAAIILYLTMSQIKFEERKDKSIKNWQTNKLIILNLIIFVWSVLWIYGTFTSNFSANTFMGFFLIFSFILSALFSVITLKNLFIGKKLIKRYTYLNMIMSMIILMGVVLMVEFIPSLLASIQGNTAINHPLGFKLFSIIIASIFSIPIFLPSFLVRNSITAYYRKIDHFSPLEKLTDLLKNKYDDTKYIGEGGFAWVYSANRSSDGQKTALKIPKFDKEATSNNFINEVSIWKMLDHPNIVKLCDINLIEIPYMELEFCDERLEDKKRDLNESISIITDVANGLKYAHSLNIIHGDIKPSNILLKKGRAKISDWGLSKFKAEKSVTLSGFTPQYAAPEQISNKYGKADTRTDIYQLGGVFYTLLTGNAPFKDSSDIYMSILNEKPIPPSRIVQCSSDLDHIILRCLSKRKEDRYQKVDELISDLNEFMVKNTKNKISKKKIETNKNSNDTKTYKKGF